jgi:hypothetical protein
MFPWIGAAGSALSLLNTVLKSGTASGAAKTGNDLFSSLGQALTGNNSATQTNAVTGSGQAAPALSSGTLATLIAMQGQGGANGRGGAFARLDADGDGSISKSEFETAANKAGVDTSSADALFGKLDTNGDGSISKSELAKATHHGHHGMGRLAQAMNSDASGATSKTTTNADGSTTTTITYADGSSVTSTTAAASGSSSSGSNQANLLEQLIKMQAQIAGGSSSSAVASTTA